MASEKGMSWNRRGESWQATPRGPTEDVSSHVGKATLTRRFRRLRRRRTALRPAILPLRRVVRQYER